MAINIRKIIREAIHHFIIKENQNDEMMAYHGTNADFDNFSTDFIGKGEGSHAYGWGIYVTQSEKTGRYYAEVNNAIKTDLNKDYVQRSVNIAKNILFKMGNGNLRELIKDGIIVINSNTKRAFIEFGREFEKYKTNEKEEIANDILSFLKRNELSLPFAIKKDYFDEMNVFEKIYEIFDQIALYATKRAISGDGREKGMESRILYQVDIPDDDGTNYLHWEDVLSDEDTKRIFLDLFAKKGYKILDKDKDGLIRFINSSGQKISLSVNTPERNNLYGFTAYNKLSSMFAMGQKAASYYLSTIGYVGITMPTGYMHGNSDGDLRNYVIFDPKNIRILKKIKY